MKETERIAEELRLLFEGPSWLGPPIYTLLSDVDDESASRRVLPTAHTIWELVLHMSAWLRVARKRLSATLAIDPTDDENWPVPAGLWESAVAELRAERDALTESIRMFAPERLDEVAPASEPQTFYVLLHGVIQHSAYHAGQIALLKNDGGDAAQTQLVTIRTFTNEPEAYVAKGALEAFGIDCMISRDDCGGQRPHLAFTGGLRLLVRADDVERAAEVLRSDTEGG